MIEIVNHRASWARDYATVASRLRDALGPLALEIHHIGSTSVLNLPAKDVVDIQVTVAALDTETLALFTKNGFERAAPTTDHRPAGVSVSDHELTKRVFTSAMPRANIHVRVAGTFNQRYPLLFRDYLRANVTAAQAYGAVKAQLAQRFPDDRDAYYDIKDPVMDIIYSSALQWAASTGWRAPQSDA